MVLYCLKCWIELKCVLFVCMEWFIDYGVCDLIVLNFLVNGDMYFNCFLMEGWEVCEVLLNFKICFVDK